MHDDDDATTLLDHRLHCFWLVCWTFFFFLLIMHPVTNQKEKDIQLQYIYVFISFFFLDDGCELRERNWTMDSRSLGWWWRCHTFHSFVILFFSFRLLLFLLFFLGKKKHFSTWEFRLNERTCNFASAKRKWILDVCGSAYLTENVFTLLFFKKEKCARKYKIGSICTMYNVIYTYMLVVIYKQTEMFIYVSCKWSSTEKTIHKYVHHFAKWSKWRKFFQCLVRMVINQM